MSSKAKAEPVIGVLALQGAVLPHKPHIEACGASFLALKTPQDFELADAFILPGGESSTMLKLIESFSLEKSLRDNFQKKPVWGICAGCILMAEEVVNPSQKSFSLMPIQAQRNGYGRQLDSHSDDIVVEQGNPYKVSYIRAPIIKALNDNVEILAQKADNPVWVRTNQYMASTFHPELTLDFPSPMHKTFFNMVKSFYN